MKELRFDGVWRTAFAFDPKCEAIIHVAADKSGGSEKKFYKRLIKTADERFYQHLKALKENKGVDPMARTLNEVMKSLPKARRAKVEARRGTHRLGSLAAEPAQRKEAKPKWT